MTYKNHPYRESDHEFKPAEKVYEFKDLYTLLMSMPFDWWEVEEENGRLIFTTNTGSHDNFIDVKIYGGQTRFMIQINDRVMSLPFTEGHKLWDHLTNKVNIHHLNHYSNKFCKAFFAEKQSSGDKLVDAGWTKEENGAYTKPLSAKLLEQIKKDSLHIHNLKASKKNK